MKQPRESKGKGGVLTGVAQKVGTAVGTVVAAISRVSEPGSKKTKRKGMSASNDSHSGAKPSRRRSKTQPAKAGTERSPLKRRTMRSK